MVLKMEMNLDVKSLALAEQTYLKLRLQTGLGREPLSLAPLPRGIGLKYGMLDCWVGRGLGWEVNFFALNRPHIQY